MFTWMFVKERFFSWRNGCFVDERFFHVYHVHIIYVYICTQNIRIPCRFMVKTLKSCSITSSRIASKCFKTAGK